MKNTEEKKEEELEVPVTEKAEEVKISICFMFNVELHFCAL